MQLADLSPREPVLRLPHPYLTPYYVTPAKGSVSKSTRYQVTSDAAATRTAHPVLHGNNLTFTEPQDPKSSERPHDSNNGPWARARRSPSLAVYLDTGTVPQALAQLWLVVYIIFTIRPSEELFRLRFEGANSTAIQTRLQEISLAIEHPPSNERSSNQTTPELLILRSAFWQGAGSPLGPRAPWTPDATATAAFPPGPLTYTLTSAANTALRRHPRRPAKPRPGAVMYSRYIPHLRETFSMVALDCGSEEHRGLVHGWLNDPRVSQGWNLAGSLEQHGAYLRERHEDPHQVAVLARFDETFFAYFEIYWAKEDRLGAYYDAHDFDRGRHSLVGDVRFRGPHRVSAWWSSLMHYLFLDDPRTMAVVGEPKYTNSTVLSYDFIHGFGLDKFVDLPEKRSGFMRCSRERFFQLCPLAENEKAIGGTGVSLFPKL